MLTTTIRKLSTLAAFVGVLALPALGQVGGTETIGFWAVPGGGGRSANGAHALTGSAGLHAAGYSANGGLTLRGGFWPASPATPTGVDDGTGLVPAATRLAAPYPNPFNPATRIGFELAAPGEVRLRIYDARGQLVRDLARAAYPAGRHQVTWDGRDAQGGRAPSGVYFVRLQADGTDATAKMTLLK